MARSDPELELDETLERCMVKADVLNAKYDIAVEALRRIARQNFNDPWTAAEEARDALRKLGLNDAS